MVILGRKEMLKLHNLGSLFCIYFGFNLQEEEQQIQMLGRLLSHNSSSGCIHKSNINAT